MKTILSFNQKWIKDALSHRVTDRVPYHFDFTPPDLYTFDVIPDDQLSLDPNAVINVSINLTDNLEVDWVLFQYQLQNDTEWTNKTMVNIYGLYWSNFSVAYEKNVTLRVIAWDTSNLESDDWILTVELLY